MLPFVVAALVGSAIATNGPKDCADKCTAKWEACKAAPNANQAFCGSEYTGCLGFSPFTNGYTKPTACAGTAEPTTTICFDCAAPTAEPTTTICFDCSPPAAEPTTTICFDCSPPAPQPTTTKCFDCEAPAPQPTQDACAKKCTEEFTKCKAAPNANLSYCASTYDVCLGFNPFLTGTALPTACVKPTTSVVVPTGKPTTTICFDCGNHPNGTAPTSRPTVTAAAGHLEPAMLLAFLGAAALL